MEDFKLKIASKLKDIKLSKLVYPSISGLFILVALVLFIFSANFISKHINLALSDGGSSGDILSLNKDDFEPIKNKLNIKINENVDVSNINQENAPVESAEIKPEVPSIENIATTTASSTPPVAPVITPEEKLALKISVLNSTKTSGLAAALKKILEESGFAVEKTGNSSPTLSGTVIKIKKGKEKYKDAVTEALSSKYTISEFQELPESEPYDIVIIIGK